MVPMKISRTRIGYCTAAAVCIASSSAGNVFNPCAHSVFLLGLETDAWARAGGLRGQYCSIDRLGCCVVGPVLLLGL